MSSNLPQSDTFIFLPTYYWSVGIIISKNTFIFNSLWKKLLKNGGILLWI